MRPPDYKRKMPDTSSLKSRKDWALWWASRGFHVFPCIPGAKQPAISGNIEAATTNAAQVEAWWTERPDANIGCVPGKSGHFVLDVDVKGDGFATLEALERQHALLPAGLSISTPSGGAHYWFRGEAATTARKLGPGLDTRGAAGYVLLPGSVLDTGGHYTLVDNDPPPPAPAWLSTALRATERHETTCAPEEDSAVNVARAVAFLERAQVAVEGEGGDALTYETAGWVRDFGIGREKCLELMLAHWNERCDPPWEEEELALKVENAYEYAQNEAGSKALPNPDTVFADVKVPLEPASTSFKYKLRSMREARERPEPQWIVPGRWPRDALAFVYGPANSYKSFNVLNDVLGMAYAGERVIYIAGEGAHGIDKKRVPAWMTAHAVTSDANFMTLDLMPPASSPAELERFCKDVSGQGFAPTVIVIDTNARFMAGMNENDAKDAGIVVAALDGMRRTFPGALLINIAHSGKESERGMRGSSAFLGAGDVVYRVEANPNTLAVKISCDKMKDAEEPANIYREGKVVDGSLVFYDMDFETWKKANADEGHSWNATGRALARLKMPFVTTEVLAAEILSDLAEDLDFAVYQHRLKALIKELRRMAPGPLSGYVLSEQGAKDLRWGLKVDS